MKMVGQQPKGVHGGCGTPYVEPHQSETIEVVDFEDINLDLMYKAIVLGEL